MKPKGRIILQDLVSHEYLASNGSWSEHCQQTREFEHLWMALLEGLNHSGRPMQIVWCFANPALNMYLPVHAGQRHPVHACEVCPIFEATLHSSNRT